jgi:thiol-disulfide isomerase/thioredoxin
MRKNEFRKSLHLPSSLSVWLIYSLMLMLPGCNSAPPPQVQSDARGAVLKRESLQPVSQLALAKPEGGEFRLADYSGKVIVVDFWATWCPPCRAQAPKLAEMSQKYRERGLEIIGFNLNQRTDSLEVKKFIQDAGMTYQSGYAEKRISDAFLNGTEDETGSAPIPQLFVFSREGKLVKHFIGNTPGHLQELEQIISAELARS